MESNYCIFIEHEEFPLHFESLNNTWKLATHINAILQVKRLSSVAEPGLVPCSPLPYWVHGAPPFTKDFYVIVSFNFTVAS